MQDNKATTFGSAEDRQKDTTPQVNYPSISSTPTRNIPLETSTSSYRPPSTNYNPVVTYIPDSGYPSPKKSSSTGVQTPPTTPQPTRVSSIYTTWPISNVTEKNLPSWTPPPLEIIPADDLEESFNFLEEAPSNRISSYEDAPINKIPDLQPSQHHPPSTVSTTSRHTPVSTTAAFPSQKPTQDTPIVTVDDNHSNNVNPFNRNDKVKYGSKHDGKSLNSAQAKLNMGKKDIYNH